MDRTNLKIGFILVVFSAFAYFVSYSFEETMVWGFATADQPYTVQAFTWPRILAGILFMLACCLVAQAMRAKMAVIEGQTVDEEDARRLAANKKRAWAFVIFMFVYLVLLDYVGFTFSLVFLSLACTMILETGNTGKLKSLAMALTISAIIVLFFSKVMYMALPRGTGIFRQFSEWLLFTL